MDSPPNVQPSDNNWMALNDSMILCSRGEMIVRYSPDLVSWKQRHLVTSGVKNFILIFRQKRSLCH